MLKILLITSEYTGHGHKSISDSLMEQFRRYDDVAVEVLDGFALIGEAGIRMSKIYGPMTRSARQIWRMTYALANLGADTVSELLAAMIRDRLVEKLRSDPPDMILTVHPMFLGSVINVLEENDLRIPVVAHQADLINIHTTWCEPRAYRTICLTSEARAATLRAGVPASRVTLGGFPTREAFCDAARADNRVPYDGKRPLKCLIMSGGEGSGNLRKYADRLLSLFDCSVTILAGRNVRMRKSLEHDLAYYGDRLRVVGFVTNVQDYMLDADLVIARGSPNVMMEAVVCAAPLILTGALPGQEEENPALFERHGLGVLCPSAYRLKSVLGALLEDGARGLSDIRAAQKAYRNFDNARNNVDYVVRLLREYKESE